MLNDEHLEYPPSDPIEVVIFDEPYLIEVKYTTSWTTSSTSSSTVPCSTRVDDLRSRSIFYSPWNATVHRFPHFDIYHVSDQHGALIPIYLPACLSLHNAEF